jgi:hypothetical protein
LPGRFSFDVARRRGEAHDSEVDSVLQPGASLADDARRRERARRGVSARQAFMERSRVRKSELEQRLRQLPPGGEYEAPLDAFLDLFGQSHDLSPQELQAAERFAEGFDCDLIYDHFGHFNPIFRARARR